MSTKPILIEFFITYTQNKVVQLPNNAIVKGNYVLGLILNAYKLYLWENKYVSTYIAKWKYTLKMIQIIAKLDEILSSILNINWLYYLKYNWKVWLCDFTKNI
jgi:hypothetical protein